MEPHRVGGEHRVGAYFLWQAKPWGWRKIKYACVRNPVFLRVRNHRGGLQPGACHKGSGFREVSPDLEETDIDAPDHGELYSAGHNLRARASPAAACDVQTWPDSSSAGEAAETKQAQPWTPDQRAAPAQEPGNPVASLLGFYQLQGHSTGNESQS